jgi:hypothetical protein
MTHEVELKGVRRERRREEARDPLKTSVVKGTA